MKKSTERIYIALVVCSQIFLSTQGFGESIGSWTKDYYFEVPDFFTIFTDKLNVSDDKVQSSLECTTLTAKNAKFLGDMDHTSGSLLSDKPNLDYWKWLSGCLRNGDLMNESHYEEVFQMAIGDDSQLKIGLNWSILDGEQRNAVLLESIHRVIHPGILLEFGINSQTLASKILRAGNETFMNMTIKEVISVVLVFTFSTDYFQVVSKKTERI